MANRTKHGGEAFSHDEDVSLFGLSFSPSLLLLMIYIHSMSACKKAFVEMSGTEVQKKARSMEDKIYNEASSCVRSTAFIGLCIRSINRLKGQLPAAL